MRWEGDRASARSRSAPGLAKQCLAAFAASWMAAAQASPAAGWDCWVDSGEGGGIRCIADRDVRPRSPGDSSADDDEGAEVLLERVHDSLHRGDPARAGELVRDRAHLLRPGDVWTVRLSAPPTETSWLEGRPARLVRALMCRGTPACPVRFHP